MDDTKLTCSFVEESPTGGYIVNTPDGEYNTKDMGSYNDSFYLKDGREIFYPEWATW